MNNMWELPQEQPYTGDVANAYNDGPNDLGKQMGAFYEIESISPAKVLKTGESLCAQPPHDPHPGRHGHAPQARQGDAGRRSGRGSRRRC